MSIIESVTEFISTCPYLPEMAAIYTDCTDSEPDNYGISDYGRRGADLHLYGRLGGLSAQFCTVL